MQLDHHTYTYAYTLNEVERSHYISSHQIRNHFRLTVLCKTHNWGNATVYTASLDLWPQNHLTFGHRMWYVYTCVRNCHSSDSQTVISHWLPLTDIPFCCYHNTPFVSKLCTKEFECTVPLALTKRNTSSHFNHSPCMRSDA